MTKAELIQALAPYDPNTEVVFEAEFSILKVGTVKRVTLVKHGETMEYTSPDQRKAFTAILLDE